MNRLIKLIGCLFLVMACSRKNEPKKPDNLISEAKMEQILYDLYIINAAKGVNRKMLETKGFFPESYVLKKHEIDSVEFAESNAYYA